MSMKSLRTFALAAGAAFGVGWQSTPASAQYGQIPLGQSLSGQTSTGYSSPAKWNHYRPVTSPALPPIGRTYAVSAQQSAQRSLELPPPTPEPIETPPGQSMSAAPSPDAASGTIVSNGDSYVQAMSAPWEGCASGDCLSGTCGVASRLPLAPYFGGGNLLFLTMENGHGRTIASGLGSGFTTSIVDPGGSTGFDVTMGRYLNCGQYGLGVTYFLFNPSRETVIRPGTPGTIRAEMPAYNNISIDAGSGAEPVYTIIDGSGAYAGAAAVRASRDLRFQGIEANLYSFGLIGSRRLAYTNCNSPALFPRIVGNRLLGRFCKGLTGPTGPLTQPCGGRVRVMTSHGFRWFQIDDEFELAYNIDGTLGYQAADLYENIDITNNLYGYQFGARLTYCLTCRLSANIGAKFGIYGNHATMRHRVGTQTAAAYRNGVPTDFIDTESSDTVLSSLGELDFGLGYRLGCAWTLTGGYRMIGVTGIADAVDSLPNTYVTLAESAQVHADDSLILHGGYVGLAYNW